MKEGRGTSSRLPVPTNFKSCRICPGYTTAIEAKMADTILAIGFKNSNGKN